MLFLGLGSYRIGGLSAMEDVHFASANTQKAQTCRNGRGFCFFRRNGGVPEKCLANILRDCSTMREQILLSPARLLTVSDSETQSEYVKILRKIFFGSLAAGQAVKAGFHGCAAIMRSEARQAALGQ